ncbi:MULTISPECIES: hypothetical protein [Methylobacteriaceae]|uniref:hypothetical protein n=1 Tax=Methylobacteriaceae TaxID=119045 RepID=UPI002F35F363
MSDEMSSDCAGTTISAAAPGDRGRLTRRTAIAALAASLAPAPLLARPTMSAAAMFRRRFVLALPMTSPVVQDAIGRPLYPSFFAVNGRGREVFILYGFDQRPGDSGAIFCVFDLDTGEIKTWFYGTQRWREALIFREHSGQRWLYSLGTQYPIRYDITELPKMGSYVSPQKIYNKAPRSYSQMAWTGADFVYMKGGGQKREFIVTDPEFNPISEFSFPLSCVGIYSKDEAQLAYPKTQGIAWFRERFVMGSGRAYVLGSRAPRGNAALPGNQQGILSCDSGGKLIGAALCNPDIALGLMGGMIGRKIRVIENEGISAANDGRLYAIWQVQHPDSFASEGRKWGIIITEEVSSGPDAVDFSKGAFELLVNDKDRSLDR